jgi:hypothetical protein
MDDVSFHMLLHSIVSPFDILLSLPDLFDEITHATTNTPFPLLSFSLLVAWKCI